MRAVQSIDAAHCITQYASRVPLIAADGDDGMMGTVLPAALPRMRFGFRLACRIPPHTGDADGYVVERHGDGRMRLMHGHVHLAHRWHGQQPIGDALRKVLDKIGMLTFDHGDNLFRGATVIDSIVQIVACPCRRKIHVQRSVHNKRLGAFMFEFQHAMRAVGMYAGKNDSIHTDPFSASQRVLRPALR